MLPGVRPYNALFDTGATTTMLSQKIISELDLLPIGTAQFRGIKGVFPGLIYLFHVAFYGDVVGKDVLEQKAIHTEKTVHKLYIFPPVIVGGEIEEEPNIDVLLGMDIINTGDLRIDRDGTFSFSFSAGGT